MRNTMCTKGACFTCPRRRRHHGSPELSATHLERCPSFQIKFLKTHYLSIDMSVLYYRNAVPAEGHVVNLETAAPFPRVLVDKSGAKLLNTLCLNTDC